MRYVRNVSACVLTLVLCAGAGLAAPIKLDFNHDTGVPTEAGWIGVNLNNRHDNGSAVDCGGGIYAGATGWNVMISRDRGTGNCPPANQDLLRDFMQPGSTGVVFKVTGLTPMDYYVTVITGDPDYPGETGDDIDINGTVVSLPDWPDPTTSATLAGLSNTVQITVASDGELKLQLGTTSYGKLAGLTFEPVPEPGCLALIALGASALVIRRRRK